MRPLAHASLAKHRGLTRRCSRPAAVGAHSVLAQPRAAGLLSGWGVRQAGDNCR